MRWCDINLNLMQALEFSINNQNVILRVFDSASQALDEEWKQYNKAFEEYLSKPREEDEAGIAFQEKNWEEDLHRQRMQGVGALALDLLMNSLQSSLHTAKKYLVPVTKPRLVQS